MNAGPRNRRIVLQRATLAKDAFNADVETWATLATVWASATPLSDAERVRAQENGAVMSMRFGILWSTVVDDLSPTDRLTYGGRTFNIVGVKELGLRDGLEITAAARAEAGA